MVTSIVYQHKPDLHLLKVQDKFIIIIWLRTHSLQVQYFLLLGIPVRNSFFVLGLVRESIPGVTLKSLNPIGGETVWDEFLTYCPLFAFLRYAFNPLVIGSGSAGESIQYNNNPYFFFCISIEHFNYHYLKPAGLFIEYLNHICIR